MNIKLTSLAFAAVLSLSAAPAAYAADEAMLARLKAFTAEQGTPLEWSGVQEYDDADGKPVVALTDVTAGAGGEQIVIDNLELVEVTEVDGGWRIGTVRLPSYRVEEDDTVVDIYDFTLDGLVVPAEGAPDQMPVYDGAGLREMFVTEKGKEVFRMNDLHVEVTYEEDGGPMEFTGAAESFKVSLEGLEDESMRAPAQAMGYESLEGFFEMEGSWNPDAFAALLAEHDEHRIERGFRGPDGRFYAAVAAAAGARGMADCGEDALLMLRHGPGATYAMGWSNAAGRLVNAHYRLLWRAIAELKTRGVVLLDLGGVDTEHGAGVARFKLGLNGEVFTLAGSFL